MEYSRLFRIKRYEKSESFLLENLIISLKMYKLYLITDEISPFWVAILSLIGFIGQFIFH